MTASLVVEAPGELPFEVRLDRDVVVVGRQGTDLALRDMNVSRQHFRIERVAGLGHVLRDERSRNGTFVNGVSVLDKVLADGDRIHVGGSGLVYRQTAGPAALPLDQAPRPGPGAGASGVHRLPVPSEATLQQAPRRVTAPIPPAAQAPQTSPAPQTFPAPHTVPAPASATAPAPGAPPTRPPAPATVLMPTPAPGFGEFGAHPAPQPFPPGGFVSAATAAAAGDPGTKPHPIRPSRAQVPTPGQAAGGERWRKLAEVACAINGEHDIDRLLERILDAVLALVPAKGGFLVMREGEALVIRANRDAPEARLDAAEGPYRISTQVCQEAIAQRRPVLTQDALSDERLGQFQTVMSLHLRSILCVPFSSQDEVLGVVYLDEPQVDPFADDGEVVELVGAFGDLAGIALANARHLRATAARERMTEELRIAARIQMNLLPKAPPDVRGLEVAGRMLPAREIGGDLYDYFRRPGQAGEVLVSIGDVSGKGVGAGLVMSQVRALVRAYAETYGPTDELLAHVNQALADDLESGQFVSFLLMRYDEESGRLSFTGAGHEHLILYRPSTRQVELMRAGGVVLGLVPDIRGRVSERHLTLQPGDVVCLYTDGATEATSAEGEEFGLDRITQTVQAGALDPGAIVDRVIEAVVSFTGKDRELSDDLTVVALRKT
ncbi:MAG: SpoIIE family protein phosphatase [Planctomycetes bacterium]|nr:SpoIIE family protein phosphatase [Planctomycetota bacterium]